MANEFKIKNGLYVSGSTTITNNTTISGSLVVVGGITGSLLGTASYAVNANTISASFAVTSASLSIRVTDLESTASALTSASASFAETSSSLSIRTTNLESTASVLTTASASFSVVSASYSSASSSLSTRVTNLEATSSTVSSSFASTSGSIAGRVTLIEGQYATTGSNNFTGPQYVSNVSNAISFTSTASLYTDGGLRVQKDFYVSGTSYFNNVVVYGTSSIQYITSSQLNIGTNLITVNTDTPTVRFGGLAVYDSGSTGLTGSMLWDSEKNHWIYANPSGSTYSGGMMISGPRNTGSLGNEVGTTACAVMIGQGGDHITSSGIFSYGNATCFYGQSFISGSGNACFSGQVCSNTVSTTDGSNVSTLANNFLRSTAGNYYFDACSVGASFNFRTSNASALDNTALFICGTNSRVGIGTTSPIEKLHIVGNIYTNGTNTNLYLDNGGPGGASLKIGVVGTTETYINSLDADPLWFGTNSIERMRITSTGNVGIGTSTPTDCIIGAGTFLDIASTSGGALKLHYTSATAYGEVSLYKGSNGSFIDSAGASTVANNDLIFRTGATSNNYTVSERLRITGGGCVGINSSSPATTLQINATSPSIRLQECSSGGDKRIELSVDSTGLAKVSANQSAQILAFETVGSERMRFTATGIACFACQVCAPTLIGQCISIRNTPLSYLTIGTYASAGNYIDSATLPTTPANYMITLAPPSTTFSYGGGIAWSEGTNVAAAINAYDDGATGALGLSISTGTNSCLAEKVKITSTGAACFACELTAKSLGTNDLILNNLNHEHANYVDGTRGSWLIQEGACDLFIINQVTCKKYKFNLIEIK